MFFVKRQSLLIVILLLCLTSSVYAQNDTTIYLEWAPDTDPLRSIVVNWISDIDDGDSELEYRRGDSGDWIKKFGVSNVIPDTSKQRNSVLIEALQPGASYQFRITDGSIDNDIHRFRLPPSDLDEPFKFIVGGDFYMGDGGFFDDRFKETATQAAGQNPWFVALGGDIANANAHPELLYRWFDFLKIWYENMITSDGYLIPMIAGLGNHEVPNDYNAEPEEARYIREFFSFPGDRGYGVHDFSDYLSIVMLNTNHTRSVDGSQKSWLDSVLNNRKNIISHVFPVMHTPAWPSNDPVESRHEDIQEHWVPIFEENGIRFVFGHDNHNYMRTFPMVGKVIDEKGPTYLGNGGWGLGTRETRNRYYIEETYERHHFILVEVTRTYRKATAIDYSGDILDSFSELAFLPPPELLPITDLNENSFRINWEEVDGAEQYRLDISTESDFSTYLSGFENRIVPSDRNNFLVVDLVPGETYYFRLRAEIPRIGSGSVVSDNSEAMFVKLHIVDPDLSSISVNENTVVANEEEVGTITVTVIDEDEELASNFPVTLFAEEGNLLTHDSTIRTNSEGQAVFEVFNDKSEVVTYGAIAGNKEITQKVQITFIPRSPVALAASNVQNREFTANWEMVDDADFYELDVATDNNFSNLVSGFQALNVGEVTAFEVTGVNPGTEYFYRIRAVSEDRIGANSQTISTTTFPDTPVAEEANDISVISFKANWALAEGAGNYRLDVARDANFESFVEGYKNLNVEDALSYQVDGLQPGIEYYYRVRSEVGPRLSENSNTVSVSTFEIDIENSEIKPEQLRVLANGEQSNRIKVTILAVNGTLQEGVSIQLIAGNDNSVIEEIEPVTNNDGTAIFGVTNTTAEKVTYTAIAAGINIGSVELEFLENDGVLSLGHNFPNPYRFNTSIPMTIPEKMSVKLEVFNSLGAPVRTLINEEIETGYYEVPFNGADLAAGVYFYRLITDEGIKTGKMVLVK